MTDRYRRLSPLYRPPPTQKPASAPSIPTIDQDRAGALLEIVRRLLDEQEPVRVDQERRQSFRRPYPQALLLTPCSVRGLPRLPESVTVVAKDLSPGSVGFVHTRSIREPFVVLTFRMRAGELICLKSVVRRIQTMRQGLYLIGCEFVQRLDSRKFRGGDTGTSEGDARGS
ncbi:MAG: hypothetical protein U1D30_05405 [Planctomycetota bacterium]